MPSGRRSRPSSPTATTTADPVTRGRITGRWSTASSGTSTPAHPGPTPPSGTDPGRPPTTASAGGAGTAPGPRSSTHSCSASTTPAASTGTSGAWTGPSSGPAEPPPGRKKNPDPVPRLGGSARTQLGEPADHALGRSRGGFGTKVHLVCDSSGTLLSGAGVVVHLRPTSESRRTFQRFCRREGVIATPVQA